MPVRLAVGRPISTLILYVGVLFFGGLAALNLPVSFLPPVAVPTLVVSAAYPGASPGEVRRLVTIPLEDAFASMKGVDRIDSVSRRGVATIVLGFHWGTDIALAGVQAREIIDSTFPLLPQGAPRPQLLPVDPTTEPVMIVSVQSAVGNLYSARQIASHELQSALQQVQGVGTVVIVGGRKREVWVEVDQLRLLSAGLTLNDVASFLSTANVDLPAGSFTQSSTDFEVRTNGRVSSPSAIARLRIPLQSGASIAIGDFARVAWHPQPQASLFMVDGKEAIGLLIRAREGTSPVLVARRLRAEIGRLQTAYRSSLRLEIVADNSSTVVDSIDGLLRASLLGGAAAFLVMLLFLRRLRPALILISSVPTSVLLCLLLLWIAGRSLDVMSLGGIALSIGMLVDDGVVVLENLERRLAFRPEGSLRDAIIAATSEVASSILGSTLTTIVVFLPVIFIPGLIGALYTDLALSVVFCLAASLVVSATLIPVLFLITYPPIPSWSGERALRSGPLEGGYRRSLAASLRRPLMLLAGLVAVGAATVLLAPSLRTELVAPFDSGTVRVTVTAAPSTSMPEMKRLAGLISTRILSHPGVRSVWCRAGGESNDTYYLANPNADRQTLSMTVRTRYGRRPDSFPIIRALKGELHVAGARVSVRLPASPLARLLGVHGNRYELSALGQTPRAAHAHAEDIAASFRRLDPAANARLAGVATVPEIRFLPRRQMLATTGITLSQVAQTAFEGLVGAVPTKISVSGRDYDVRVILEKGERSTLPALGELRLRSPNGNVVRIDDLVRITEGSSPSKLVRVNRRDAVSIVVSAPPGGNAMLQRALSVEVLKSGVVDTTRTIFAEHMTDIFVVLAVALLLLYLLLGAQFESFVQPLIVLSAVPLAGLGALGGLIASGHSLNLSSGLGILVLLGTTVKVSIILFTNYRRRIDRGAAPLFAVYTGTAERLRPILISSLATVCALFPVALNLNGLSTEDGIAIAVIGGLSVSTVLTLYVVPLLSRTYYRRRKRRRMRAFDDPRSPGRR